MRRAAARAARQEGGHGRAGAREEIGEAPVIDLRAQAPLLDLWPPFVEPEFVAKLRGVVLEVVAPIAARTDRDDVYPLEAVRALAAAGYNAITFPAEHGG